MPTPREELLRAAEMLGGDAGIAAATGFSLHAVRRARLSGRAGGLMASLIEAATRGAVSREALAAGPPLAETRRGQRRARTRPGIRPP